MCSPLCWVLHAEPEHRSWCHHYHHMHLTVKCLAHHVRCLCLCLAVLTLYCGDAWGPPSPWGWQPPSAARHSAAWSHWRSKMMEQRCRDAPKSHGQFNLKIPTQAWQVPGHSCAKPNWHLPGEPQKCYSLQRGHRGGKVRSCSQDKPTTGDRKGLPSIVLELLLLRKLSRRKERRSCIRMAGSRALHWWQGRM